MSVTSQSNYERGERTPRANYLAAVAALGVDVQYVVTGVRATPLTLNPFAIDNRATVLSAEEAALVDNYRHAGREGRLALEAASSALAKPRPKVLGE